MIHETGPAAGREIRCAARFPDTDVLVFGHSHIPWDTVAPSGLRLLNPGSPTDRRRQPHGTYMTAEITNATLTNVALHPIPLPLAVPASARDLGLWRSTVARAVRRPHVQERGIRMWDQPRSTVG